ncbi:MAG TPA: sigma-70 family RNA polymerase sigma factor [Candidatus Hydrogenedentes bacterium]|nr:sigma-70 family RNA polymerase sigma factor [Candidatus Hydrogenedentota bacterium]HNT87330.1 sigma-70 family RNA polymerase sigma factor [Candidatus Hydrogenedentota bacterium]
MEVVNEPLRSPPPRDDDAALVAAAQAGDRYAFEELVRRYRNDVFALSLHFVKNREEAWDISQDVFVKAYGSLGSFRGEASFKTWLLRITANRCKDFFKKRKLETTPFDDALAAGDPPSGTLHPGRQSEARELGAAIEEAVAQLPEKHRTAFLLREYEGMSYQEMADTMGCNIGTVMSRLHHARRKLQNSLIKMGFVEETGHG